MTEDKELEADDCAAEDSDDIVDDGDNVPDSQLEELMAERDRFKDSYLRAHAEMENLRKRSAMEIEKNRKYAISSFAKDLLSVADSMERALASVPGDVEDEVLKGFISGVEITLKELKGIFARNKITEIESVGHIFNPDYHQAVQMFEDESKENGMIVSEWQKGYMIEDRMLRDATVIVVKNPKK